MKKGDECRCERCGELYTYHGGRPNPYCPDCFAVVRRERATEQMRKYRAEQPKRKKEKPKPKPPAKKAAAVTKTVQLPGTTAPTVSRKRARCGNDAVSRTVHKIELLNKERREQGLPPLSYGKAVALLKL